MDDPRPSPSVRDWPRLMSVHLAAEYCGISPNLLRENGPRPVQIGQKRKLYDRKLLDKWVDQLSGAAPTSPESQWDED